jgi:hypothetical protein
MARTHTDHSGHEIVSNYVTDLRVLKVRCGHVTRMAIKPSYLRILRITSYVSTDKVKTCYVSLYTNDIVLSWSI